MYKNIEKIRPYTHVSVYIFLFTKNMYHFCTAQFIESTLFLFVVLLN